MLKSQDTANEQSPSSGASKARVTPEELTEALAAIETRKQAEASRLAGTIPLEDAVSELHLDSTPEEIWVEVQSQRIKAASPEPQSFAEAEAARREQRRQAHAAPAPAQTRPLMTPLRFQLPQGGRRRWLRPFIPFFAVWALFATGVIPHFWNHSSHPFVSAPQSLAQVPDGKEVYADNIALIQISEGKSPAQITVDGNQNENRWGLIKVGGHVYLRGYIASTDSLAPLQGKSLNVYNDDDSGELDGEKTSNITLRVDNIPLQKSGGEDNYSEITLPHFQPDPLTTLIPWH